MFLYLTVICDAPLFIRGHSKAILSKAIHNDTEFLSTNMVMDYSLLVGIDEVRMKLVVGIIGNALLLFFLFVFLVFVCFLFLFVLFSHFCVFFISVRFMIILLNMFFFF